MWSKERRTEKDSPGGHARRRLSVPASLFLIGLGLAAVGTLISLRVAGASVRELLESTDATMLLAEAKNANAANDIKLEAKLLERAATLEGDADDLAEVERRLAVLDWKYHLRFQSARERLQKQTTGAEPAEAWLALSRLEWQAKEFEDAIRAARKALEVADKESERRRAKIAFSAAAVERATQARFAGEAIEGDALQESLDLMQGMVRREPGEPVPSRLLTRAALLLGQGKAALLGWRSYFHTGPGLPVPNAIADAGAELERLLPGWDGADTGSEARAVVAALTGSRWFTEAALVALDPRTKTPRKQPAPEAVAYARTLRRVRELTDEYYRLTSLGKGSRSNWEGDLLAEFRGLQSVLEGREISKGSFDREKMKRLLADRFGAYVGIGKTAGYADLHMGHSVVDETRTVEQYGHRAELRFIALDSIVSNGFQSWAWENGAQHGGWARTDTIYQVRPAYSGSPLRAWRQLTGAEELEELREDIREEAARDEKRAADDPHAFLPGLRMRLKQQGLTQLLERLRGRGLDGEELRVAFLSAYGLAEQESSIFAHEGRHAIDKRRDDSLSSFQMESTAKLSEVTFAPEPRLAMGAIFSESIGDGSPHGRANLKIMKSLVAWMDENSEAIENLDTSRPLLPQFDLLTDEQIRAAFRSMDPLAS